MKRLVLISCCAVLAFAQAPTRRAGNLNLGHEEITFSAERTETSGATLHLSGNVAIETDTVLIKANEADFNKDTREIVIDGPIRVKLK